MLGVCRILTIASLVFSVGLSQFGSDVSFTHITDTLKIRKSTDFVVIIGRHKSVGREAFYKTGRPIAISLLKYFAMVHKYYTRLAVITYADSATVDYDDISNNPQPRHKCQIFPSEKTTASQFDVVKYDVLSENSSCGYEKALSFAREIFNRGKSHRNDVTQIALLMTSGIFEKCEPSVVSKDVLYAMKQQAVFFGAGIGKIIDDEAIKKLVSTPNIRFYGNGELWIENFKNSMQRFDQPLLIYEEMSSVTPCLAVSAAPSGARCYCDLNFGLTRWMCPEGYFESISANGVVSCKVCPQNTFKSVVGSSSCTNCSLDQGVKKVGSTSWQDCFSFPNPFSNPCINGKCTSDQLCVPRFIGNVLIDSNCIPCNNFGGPVVEGCPTRMCYSSSPLCQNSGQCVDLVNDFACICPGLYYGRYCQFQENNCRFPMMCGTNRCINEPSGGFKCECSVYNTANKVDEMCDTLPSTTTQQPETTTTQVSSPTTTTTKFPVSPVVLVSDEPVTSNPLTVGVATAVALLVAVSIATGIVIYIRWKKKNVITPNPLNLFESFNNETLMGGTLNQKLFSRNRIVGECDTIKEGNMLNGVPSVPAEVDSTDSVRRQSQINGKQSTMDDWKKYFDKLVTRGDILKGLIIDLHKKEFASSNEWDVNWNELYSLDHVLGSETSVNVQADEYLLGRPKNRTIVGRTVQSDDDLVVLPILIVGRTRNYLIVSICESDRSEGIIREMAQHIYSEGY